jgi:hypothetical protein
MKRYRNLAVIAVVTIISIGMFYTKVATSESKLPNFYLSTVKGDSKDAKNLVIYAGYQKDNIDQNVSITSTGSEYRNHTTLIDELKRKSFEIEKLNKLQKDENSYMRGKNWAPNFYYDKDYVWYADVRGKGVGYEEKNHEYKLHIDGLDRESKDRITLKLDISGEEDYSYINVEDVQLIGKELVVTTYQNKNNYSGNHDGAAIENIVEQNERVIYRVNVNQKKIVDRKVISSSKNENNIHTDIQTAIEVDPTHPKQYYVMKESTMKEIAQSNGESIPEEVSSALHVINLETGKEEALNLTKEQLEMVKQSEMTIDHNDLYFVVQNENGLSVLKYSLERKKIEGKPINISKQINETLVNNKVVDGKLYTIITSENKTNSTNQDSIHIVDLNDGKILYEGNIKLKNSNEQNDELLNKLNFYELVIQ